jgi:hypothetical protein
MQVVRHDDEGVEFELRSQFRSSPPFFLNETTNRAELDFPVDDHSECQVPSVNDEGYEIGTGLAVVVVAESDGPPVPHLRHTTFPTSTNSTVTPNVAAR